MVGRFARPCPIGAWVSPAGSGCSVRRAEPEPHRHCGLCAPDEQLEMGLGARQRQVIYTDHRTAQGFRRQRIADHFSRSISSDGTRRQTSPGKVGIAVFGNRSSARKIGFVEFLHPRQLRAHRNAHRGRTERANAAARGPSNREATAPPGDEHLYRRLDSLERNSAKRPVSSAGARRGPDFPFSGAQTK